MCILRPLQRVEGARRPQEENMTDTQIDRIVDAIRKGFSDLGDRFAQGKNPENVAMSLKMIAEALERIAETRDEAQ